MSHNYHKCYYKYNFNTILYFYPELHNSHFKYSPFYCLNYTNNISGLCNYHINDYICPCYKHDNNNNNINNNNNTYNYILKDLLFDNDIFYNINRFLSIKNKKLINCTSKYLYTTITKTNILYNTNTERDIIYNVTVFLSKNKNINVFTDLNYKMNNIYNIFEFLSINTKFIFQNIKFAFIILNKLIEFKNINIIDNPFDYDFNQQQITHINTEFKNKMIDYIITLYNINPKYIKNLSYIDYKTFQNSLISLDNSSWPAKTKQNKLCKKCLQKHHMNFCYIHKNILN